MSPLPKGRHFLVKHFFDNEADENDDGRDDAAYNDKFHDFLIWLPNLFPWE